MDLDFLKAGVALIGVVTVVQLLLGELLEAVKRTLVLCAAFVKWLRTDFRDLL